MQISVHLKILLTKAADDNVKELNHTWKYKDRVQQWINSKPNIYQLSKVTYVNLVSVKQ